MSALVIVLLWDSLWILECSDVFACDTGVAVGGGNQTPHEHIVISSSFNEVTHGVMLCRNCGWNPLFFFCGCWLNFAVFREEADSRAGCVWMSSSLCPGDLCVLSEVFELSSRLQ